ncbi:MAG: DNA repair and recombination protein RadA [Candidatus Parvarchaeota archaeon]|nr:DNA repair and recombination protein RadA [Candidatus Jingweiarchaeum tengchongense]MCW1300507.1 DNA repair and recombination protein RadA [Candidatus Jingweiarchaeum tengchongense]MCW1304678.1 DNA repair and recombination protein RadA [Candidatus Jingweiarchaeum tengchongense]MCW1305867.1 DNA repair and recombination protein RadA [Candidatus Jingweiarchaeum tengchongense]MCW1309444.1 DNA repair and recombination protein RadA [Candidatus Jingweiarchaeum tengchongense]
MTEKEEELEIEKLSGVGEATAKKLKDAGFSDLMAIATAPPTTLAEVCELGEATARKIIIEARKKLKMGFISGNELLEKQKDIYRITTGSKALDTLLGGGIATQSITEAYGPFGASKTQLGFQLCVNVQLPMEKGGLNACAVFIDTEGTFRPVRIIDMAKAVGLDPKEALNRIKVARAYSSDHQILLAEKIPDLIREKVPVKLIVVDSLTALFRAEYIGRGTLADRQQKLNQHIHFLQRLADRYNLAVYVTNQVMAKPDIFFGDPTAPIGGHVLGHSSTYRIYLRKAKGDKRVARMIDSPDLPEGEAIFRITNEGIRD